MNAPRTALFALIGMLVTAGAGCKSCGDTELLERELRIQEDEIYRLRSLIDNAPMAGSSNIILEPSTRTPADDGPRLPEVEVPNIQLPPGVENPAPSLRPPMQSPDRSSLDEAPRFEATPAQAAPTQRVRRSSDPRVRYVTLDQGRTGGQRNGGLRVVLEPRNAAGDVVTTPGAVSVVVLDPAFSGPQARVARWDFAARDIQTLMSVSRDGTLELDLDWPQGEPRNNKLNLYVRYRTPDGEELRAESEFYVNGNRTAWDQAQSRPAPAPQRIRSTGPTASARSPSPQPTLAHSAPSRSVRSTPEPERLPQFILHGDREDPRNPQMSSAPRVRLPR